MSLFPNGMSPDESRFHALMVARDCTADLMKPDETLRAANSFYAFLIGEERTASVVQIKRAESK